MSTPAGDPFLRMERAVLLAVDRVHILEDRVARLTAELDAVRAVVTRWESMPRATRISVFEAADTVTDAIGEACWAGDHA